MNCKICGRYMYSEDETSNKKYCKWCIIELCEDYSQILLAINKFLFDLNEKEIESIEEAMEIIKIAVLEM